MQDKWLKNLTDVQLPHNTKMLLSLGPKFGITPSLRDFSIIHLLADIEYIIEQEENGRTINLKRANVTNIITNYIRKHQGNTQLLNNILKETRTFLKEHPEIIGLKADKGNTTVVMYEQHYDELAKQLLSDNTYYQPLPRDPTSSIQQKSNKLISKFERQKLILQHQND